MTEIKHHTRKLVVTNNPDIIFSQYSLVLIPKWKRLLRANGPNPLQGKWCSFNRSISQIPQCIRQISHNTSVCNRNVHTFLLQSGALWDIILVHCGICEMVLLYIYIPWSNQRERLRYGMYLVGSNLYSYSALDTASSSSTVLFSQQKYMTWFIICMYRRISNIRGTLVSNKIVDVVGASPVGAAPTTSLFST